MNTESVEQGKTMAIISYITIIGLIIAFVMNNDKKNDFTSFHIRQSLGISLLAIAFTIIFSFISIPFLPMIVNLLIIVLWVLGLIGAIQGEKKLVPVLGPMFQDWFKGIG